MSTFLPLPARSDLRALHVVDVVPAERYGVLVMGEAWTHIFARVSLPSSIQLTRRRSLASSPPSAAGASIAIRAAAGLPPGPRQRRSR